MDLNKCCRCGAFHTNPGDICPKCSSKDGLELSTFKSYIEENGVSSIDTIATQTGIAQKNVNRFLGYEGLNTTDTENHDLTSSGVVFN